jgi:hypothetical protein
MRCEHLIARDNLILSSDTMLHKSYNRDDSSEKGGNQIEIHERTGAKTK